MDVCYEVLTPSGVAAGIAVVRVAGPDAARLIERVAGRPVSGGHFYGVIRPAAGEAAVDDVVIVPVATSGPAFDICCHGGPAVVAAVCVVLAEAGARVGPAATEAERLLSRCRTELAFRHVSEHLQGRVPLNRHLIEAPMVVLAGLPNAGKSSLMNALVGNAGLATSIVAPEAGTTRDAVEAEVDCDGLIVRLVDAPGFRATTDSIEARAIELARGFIEMADLLVHVRDGTAVGDDAAPPAAPPGQCLLTVFTRADLTKRDGLSVSCVTGEGIGDLRRSILRTFVSA